MAFKAVVITKEDDEQKVALASFDQADLMEGDTLVAVSHSSLNYKDGLAITGRGPVVRRYPMIPGIDFAGKVVETSDPDLKVGDMVVLNGWGTGETHLGAFGEYSRVPGKWLLPLPDAFTSEQAMAIGTAGYTAALCVLALQQAGLKPTDGPALVTGAAGGVGSVAVALLAKAGWHVIASTGRAEEGEYLKRLGAVEILSREELDKPARPLGKERWITAVDVVGNNVLANVLASTSYGGAVAACGLAGGMQLPTSVAPFILRNVSLLGVDSVMTPREKRLAAWQLLAELLDPKVLADITTTVGLEDVLTLGDQIVDGKVRGRVVVSIAGK